MSPLLLLPLLPRFLPLPPQGLWFILIQLLGAQWPLTCPPALPLLACWPLPLPQVPCLPTHLNAQCLLTFHQAPWLPSSLHHPPCPPTVLLEPWPHTQPRAQWWASLPPAKCPWLLTPQECWLPTLRATWFLILLLAPCLHTQARHP